MKIRGWEIDTTKAIVSGTRTEKGWVYHCTEGGRRYPPGENEFLTEKEYEALAQAIEMCC